MADFYIDFTAIGGGAGTFVSPWNRYALITGTTTADTVWVRRVSYTETAAAPGIGPAIPHNTPVVGWPLVGDTLYATRPVAAQAAWDPDAGLYATVLHYPVAMPDNLAVSLCTLGLAPNASKTFKLSRLKFFRRASAAFDAYSGQGVFGFKSEGTTQSSSHTYIFERCWLEFDGGSVDISSANVGPGAVCYFGTRYAGTSSHSITDLGSTFLSHSGVVRPWTQVFILGDAGSVTTTLAMTNSVLQIDNPSSDAGLPSSWFHATGTHSVSGVLDGCTLEWLTVNRASDLFQNRLANPSGLLFHRCTFKTLVGSPAGYNRFRSRNYRYVDCIFLNLLSIDINDSGCSFSAYYLQLASDPGSPGIGLSTAPNFVRVANAFFAPNAARDISFVASTEGRGSGVVSIRTLSESGSGLALATNGLVLTSDPVGSPGYRKLLSLAGVTQVVSASRVGGAPYSFYLTPANSGFARAAGVCSAESGFDSVFVTLVPGTNTITVFGAHAGYATAPTTADAWIELEVPSSTGNVVTSGRPTALLGVALTADTSTWNAITGTITRFNVTASVTTPVAVVAILRMYAAAPVGGIYFDPSAVVS